MVAELFPDGRKYFEDEIPEMVKNPCSAKGIEK